MKRTLFLLAVISVLFSCSVKQKNTKNHSDLKTLIGFMEGSFSSEAQSIADTTYLHITLDMKRIWPENPDGVWLYVEQTAAWTPGKPYRQRIYHVQQHSDSTFSSSIYTFPNPEDYIGGHLKPGIFDGLPSDSVKILEGCALLLTYRNNSFSGETKEGECLNAWGEATYATSEVSIFPDHMLSWDRGWNDKKEQVWGAEKGGYKFDKLPKLN